VSEHSDSQRDTQKLKMVNVSVTPVAREMDKATMIEKGHSRNLPLYLSRDEVTNWPGSLRFRVSYQRKGRHNIAGSRTTVYFTGPEGKRWYGVQYGEFTQIVHCRRMAARAGRPRMLNIRLTSYIHTRPGTLPAPGSFAEMETSS